MTVETAVSASPASSDTDTKARELCRDRDLQRCAAFWRPETKRDLSFDNLAACYGTSASNERKD